MNEQAGFEARAVLTPRRRRMARLAPLLPVVALVAVTWAGFSGARSDRATEIPDRTADAARSSTVEGSTPAPVPAQVLGLDVQRLDEVQAQSLGRDDVIAVAGWYVATAITDCPPLAALYRQGSLPEVRGDVDEAAFCDRFGALYASQPDVEHGASWRAGLPAVGVTIVMGVVVPRELEMIGADATEVVVVGRFEESGDGCRDPAACPPELVVDHVAWTPGA